MRTWNPLHKLEMSPEQLFLQVTNDNTLGSFLFELVDQIYPKRALPSKPDVPNYLPLKIAIVGHVFSGRRTMAELIRQK